MDGMIERRPTGIEERRMWNVRTRRGAQRMRAVRTCACGEPATAMVGDLETGVPYCGLCARMAENKRERERMRRVGR